MTNFYLSKSFLSQECPFCEYKKIMTSVESDKRKSSEWHYMFGNWLLVFG